MIHTRNLSRLLAPALLCGGLTLVSLPSLAAHQVHRVSTPRDSYLQYKVYSVEQLIQQVSSNTDVRQRFARHFQIPESRVVSYMRANLVESYVPKTGRYTVYCMRKSGAFYPVKQTFRRGTKVFALRNGEPVMKWVCGNPLSKFLPDIQVHNITKPVKKVAGIIQELSPTETANILVPSEVVTPVYEPAIPLSLVSASAPVLVKAGTSSLLPFLLPIALIGVAGGGSNGNHTPTPPAVPESGTLALLSLGLPVAIIVARRRRVRL